MVLCSQVYSIDIRRVYQVLVNVEHDEFTRSMKTIQVVVTGSNRFVNVNLQCKCPEANKKLQHVSTVYSLLQDIILITLY
jgi:hypothetical protein